MGAPGSIAAVDKRVKEKDGNEVYMVAEIDESGVIVGLNWCASKKAAMGLLTAAIEVGLTPKARAKIGLASQNRMKSKSPLGDKRAIG